MKLIVYVKPGSRRDQILKDGDRLILHIRALPKNGEANDYAIKFLAKSLNTAQSNITIISGRTNRQKIIQVNLPPTMLEQKISAVSVMPQAKLFYE